MTLDARIVDRFFQVLVEEIRARHPEYLERSFTVAEIYQSLVPYRTHRDRIGVELNGDYEEALLGMLVGDPPYLKLESEPARERIRRELASKNPNTGIFREYAALGVRLSSDRLPDAEEEAGTTTSPGRGAEPDAEALDAPGPAAANGKPVADDVPTPPGRGDTVLPAEAHSGEEARPEECPACDAPLPDRPTLRFCPSCGTNVLVVPCASCGEELDRDWSFCVACGAPASG